MHFPYFTRAFGRLENILKIDLRYALTGGVFLTVTQVVSAVGALVLTIAYANLLPVETYGTYRYILAVYALLAIAALPGFDTAVSQSVALGYDSALRTGISAKFRWGLLGALASFVYAGYFYASGSFLMGHIFILIGIVLPIMESFALFTSFLNAKRLFKHSAVIDILTQAVSIASLVTTIFLTKNILILLVAYFAPYAAARILATLYVQRRHVRESSTDPGLFKYARSMTFFQILSRLISSADQIVLFHFLGPAQVAIFSLATAIPNRIQSLFRISGTLAFPKFATRTAKEIASSLPRKMMLFALLILSICLVYIAAAPLLFTHIFPQYLPSLVYSQAVVFYTLSSITYPFGSYLMAHKKVRDTYVMAIAGFVTKILCLVGLVPFFGIWGAVLGLLATSSTNILLTLWFIYRERRTASSDT